MTKGQKYLVIALAFLYVIVMVRPLLSAKMLTGDKDELIRIEVSSDTGEYTLSGEDAKALFQMIEKTEEVTSKRLDAGEAIKAGSFLIHVVYKNGKSDRIEATETPNGIFRQAQDYSFIGTDSVVVTGKNEVLWIYVNSLRGCPLPR